MSDNEITDEFTVEIYCDDSSHDEPELVDVFQFSDGYWECLDPDGLAARGYFDAEDGENPLKGRESATCPERRHISREKCAPFGRISSGGAHQVQVRMPVRPECAEQTSQACACDSGHPRATRPIKDHLDVPRSYP